EGGMRAWSLAWNTAEVSCPGSTARIVQLRRTGKGCLSYLIGSNGAAVVIDASLDPQVYHRLADEHGWRIRTILETHVHADHLFRVLAAPARVASRARHPACTYERARGVRRPAHQRNARGSPGADVAVA